MALFLLQGKAGDNMALDDNNDGSGYPLFTFVDENIFKKETFLCKCIWFEEYFRGCCTYFCTEASKASGFVFMSSWGCSLTSGFSGWGISLCFLHNRTNRKCLICHDLFTHPTSLITSVIRSPCRSKAFSSTDNLLMTNSGVLHKHRARRVHCSVNRKMFHQSLTSSSCLLLWNNCWSFPPAVLILWCFTELFFIACERIHTQSCKASCVM